MPLPPRWALGCQQCRFSYFPESRVREIAAGFRTGHIACDVIWLDIDYMSDFRNFTFDALRFPDPRRLNDELHERGFKTVWMIDLCVKVEEGYAVLREETAAANPDRRPFVLTRASYIGGQRWWTCADSVEHQSGRLTNSCVGLELILELTRSGFDRFQQLLRIP